MEDYAIKVAGLSKHFKIPHEKTLTLKQAVLSSFAKKTYEEFTALDDLNFEVKKGEFFGIIGRNGSGKSTLLKILAGIYVPNSGTVSISGKLSPFLELGVGFNPELTGRANILLGGSVLGLTRKEIIQKMDKIIDFSELRDFIDMKLKNYSSGMQVRLAFSLAINVHAEILLMDEVLAVGDSNFQSKCLDEFNRYKEEGKTVLLVTHDIGVIQKYCDRAMLIKKGKVELIGNADKIANAYLMQNISDMYMANAPQAPEPSQAGECKINKIAAIKSVQFINSSGKPANIFKTGDDISVRVDFETEKKEGLNFGFGLYSSENNTYLLGINTLYDKVDVSTYIKNKYFQVDLKNIPLKSGRYFAKIGIVSNNFNNYYDYLDKSPGFKVFSLDKNEGLFDISYKWGKG